MKKDIQRQYDRHAQNNESTKRIISALSGTILTVYGARERSVLGGVLAATGGILLLRGITGQFPFLERSGRGRGSSAPTPVHVEESLTIYRSPDEVYAFWRNLKNLPRFMQHLESVTVDDEDGRSHWRARLPRDIGHLEWTAEITAEREGREISWQSIPGSEIYNSGRVEMRPAPGERGTEVHVSINYDPPLGAVGQQAAAFLNRPVKQWMKEDIRRFKAVIEAGEAPTVEGQTRGG